VRKKIACLELLEDRRLFDIAPTVLATFPNGVGPVIWVADGIFGTTPATSTSAGTTFSLPFGSDQPNTLGSFGPNNSSNTLGIDPNDILVDQSGNMAGDTESGGADGGGTLWGAAAGAGLSNIQVQTPLNFSGVSDLSRDNLTGAMLGLGTSNGSTSVFAYTPGGSVLSVGSGGSTGSQTPVAVLLDSGGNAFILYSASPQTGSSITILPTGNYSAAGTTFNPFGALGAVQPTGMAFDAANNLFITVSGSTSTSPSALVEIKAGAQTASLMANWTSSTMPGLEHPVLDDFGDVFAIAYNPADPTRDPAELVVLLAGQTQFKSVLSLSNANAITGLTTGYPASASDILCGVMGDSIVQFPDASTLRLELSTTAIATFGDGAPTSVVTDSTGDLFGTVPATNTSAGSIFEIPAGATAVTTLATFGPVDSTNTLGISPGNLLIDSSGDLYGACPTGGPTSGGTLWELPRGSSSVEVLTTLGGNRIVSLAMDSSGGLFGEGEYLNQAFPEGSTDTAFAWTPTDGLQVLDRQLVRTGIALPELVTADAAGNAYVLEGNINETQSIAVFTPGNYNLSEGTTFQPFTHFGTPSFNTMTTDAAGDLFLTGSPGLLEIKAGTRVATQVVQNPPASLSGIAEDPAGDIYAVAFPSSGYNSIVEIPTGQSAFETDLTLILSANPISALAPDSSGNLFAVENDSIVELQGVGTATTPPVTPPITPPTTTPTKGLSPTILTARVPTTALAEARVAGLARLQIKPLVDGAGAGIASTTLYAVSATDAIQLSHFNQRYKTTTAALNATIHFAARLPAGTYNLIAQTVDAAGDTVNSALGGTITVAARVENVTASLTAVSSKLAAGRTGIARVLLNSSGNVPATGPLSISVTADGYTLASETIHIRSLKGRASIQVRIRIPSTMPAGSYSPLLTTTWDGTAQTQTSAISFEVT
jgi:hypothetical protein